MIRKTESSIEKYFNSVASKYNFISIKLTAISNWGFPDRTCIGKYSQIFFVELKRDKNESPRKLQTNWHKILRRCGFNVYVCKSKEEIQKAIEFEAKVERTRLSKAMRTTRI